MPGQPPAGDPAPADGRLPRAAVAEAAADGTMGWYIHVPYCSTRCGYCDFNTYTATELGPGVSQRDWATTARDEVRLARRVLGDVELSADTVFFGGGTPTLLPAADLVSVLRTMDEEFGLAPNAEVTVEANPDTVTEELMAELAAGGVNRVSIGMQSADPGVLRVLERTHDPHGVAAAVSAARRAGIQRLSLDLIYGTPGESADSWHETVSTALGLRPDHVSAYCLGIEEGTKLGARVRAGLLPEVDQDAAADRYEAVDDLLSAAGLAWYEISNWAPYRGRSPGTTSAIGGAATGGESGRGPTRTSGACAGGTCAIRATGPPRSLPATARRWPGRCCPRPSGRRKRSCCDCDSPRDSTWQPCLVGSPWLDRGRQPAMPYWRLRAGSG